MKHPAIPFSPPKTTPKRLLLATLLAATLVFACSDDPEANEDALEDTPQDTLEADQSADLDLQDQSLDHTDATPDLDAQAQDTDAAPDLIADQPDTTEPDDCAIALDGAIYDTHSLRFRSQDGATQVAIRRSYIDWGVGESVLYGLLAMAVVRNGECTRVDDEAALSYENSHHNWRDRAQAEADAIRYELAMDFNLDGTGWSVALAAYDASDHLLWEAPELITTGAPLICHTCPSAMQVAIFEVQNNNVSTLSDEANEFDPWIELYNFSSSDVALAGYGLSLDPANPHAWTFPEGTLLPRQGSLLVWVDGQAEQGPLHTDFVLEPGAQILLSMPDGTSAGERVFGATEPDYAWAYRWESAAFELTATPTPGAENEG